MTIFQPGQIADCRLRRRPHTGSTGLQSSGVDVARTGEDNVKQDPKLARKQGRLQSAAAISLLYMGLGMQPSQAQQPPQTQPQADTKTVASPTAPAPPGPIENDTKGNPALPQAPGPRPTEPLYLRDTPYDYTQPKSHLFNPVAPYTPMNYPAPRLGNAPGLADLAKDGKIYLSLSDAVALGLENNYDIAIARINLDIADTDVLRARAGSSLRGVSTGLVENTLGGATSTITGGGGPGGTSNSVGGGGTGVSGLVLSTNGGGPLPETLDPSLTAGIEYEAQSVAQATTLTTGVRSLTTDTGTYNFNYAQGFLTGTQLTVGFNNSHITSTSLNQIYSPELLSNFRVTATQHLLQGFGPGINGRFIVQAKNDRRITDSAFRQQLLYTVNQIENIYWGLVSAYEDEQAKERALAQSTQLSSDNRMQLQFGALAPLDVIDADTAMTADRQALIASKSNLEYQQLIMKQAIVRNLNDPQLSVAPVVPTDRVGLDRLPEEDMAVEDLVREAYVNNPQIEQAILNMKNNEITIKAEKNGLLPFVDAYAFYGGSALGGRQNTNLNCGTSASPAACPPEDYPPVGYGSTFANVFNNSSPDRGVGVNITLPIRNRTAQADQARSQMEYRQSEMRLQQLYTQVRIQVINGQYALTNDRAQVTAARAQRDYAAQSLLAEQTRYKLGASTTANILLQGRNLAIAEDNLISATAAYAKDRAALEQLLSITLERYGINLQASASGTVAQTPTIPNLTAPTPSPEPKPLTSKVPPPPAIE
jgi:outer membrane protein TolC